MYRVYKPSIPQTIGEMMEHLADMLLTSPSFRDKTGYFPEQNIDTMFFELTEGLKHLRGRLGEVRYLAMADMAATMRALFEADPEDKTGDCAKGQRLILDMEEMVKEAARRPRR